MIDHDLVTFYLNIMAESTGKQDSRKQNGVHVLQMKRKLKGKLMLLIKVRTSGPYVFRYWEYFYRDLTAFNIIFDLITPISPPV